MTRLTVPVVAAALVAVLLGSVLVLQWRGSTPRPPAASSTPSTATETTARAGAPAATVTATAGTGPAAPAPTSSVASAIVDPGGAAGRRVLTQVMPVWGSVDLRDPVARRDPQAWVATWTGGAVSEEFTRASRDAYFGEVAGGALRLQVSLLGARVTSTRLLWSSGDQAMWRVGLRRRTVSFTGLSGLDGSETVAWDVLARRDGDRVVLESWSAPSPTHESGPKEAP